MSQVSINSSKILITGSNGLLGSNLGKFFSSRNRYDVYTTSLHSSSISSNHFIKGDLLDNNFARKIIININPQIIINTVGPINLDKCEDDPQYAKAITVDTAVNVAKAASLNSSRLIYISTDHLFDGKSSLYLESDIPSPVNIYGKMKLEAESQVLKILPNSVIVRTNFYGWSPKGHPLTFAEWVYDSLHRKIPITLFTDYYYTPIEVTHLAETLEIVALSNFTGIINIIGSERCSKYDFGLALAEVFGLDPSPITAGTIEAFTFKARRQKDLSLSTEKFNFLFKKQLPGLKDGLSRFRNNEGR